jgi:hypothetical protein
LWLTEERVRERRKSRKVRQSSKRRRKEEKIPFYGDNTQDGRRSDMEAALSHSVRRNTFCSYSHINSKVKDKDHCTKKI